jgi:hypothetical protein
MEKVMERRSLLTVLVVVVLGAFMLTGAASASAAGVKAKAAAEEKVCIVHSLPSFIDQGEKETHSTVADVVEVECKAVFAQHTVQFSANELGNRCEVTWFANHSPFIIKEKSSTIKGIKLDDAGNAEVAFIAGPSCAAGEVLISAHLEEAPFSTATTGFTVLGPAETKPGLFVLGTTNKPSQVEDAFDSSLFGIVEVEFPSVYSEEEVEIAAEQLFSRCHEKPKLVWFVGTGKEGNIKPGETIKIKLNNNGNAFVLFSAEESCAPGESLFEASLVKAPYTTFEEEFTIEGPHETF